MAQTFTLDKNGTLTEGMTLTAMSKAILALAEENPTASAEDMPVLVNVHKGYGPVAIIRPQQDTHTRDSADPSEVLSLVPGEIVVFDHKENPAASWSICATPSGYARCAQGASTAVRVGPLQVPDTTPQAPMINKVLAWFYNGRVGQSSAALAMHLALCNSCVDVSELPMSWRTANSIPLDGSDLRRCALLLAAVPELLDLLPKMASLSPQWGDLVSPGSTHATVLEDKIAALTVSAAPSSITPTFRRLTAR